MFHYPLSTSHPLHFYSKYNSCNLSILAFVIPNFSSKNFSTDPLTTRHALGKTSIVSAITAVLLDRKSTRLNSSHVSISYAVFCLKKKSHCDCRVLRGH